MPKSCFDDLAFLAGRLADFDFMSWTFAGRQNLSAQGNPALAGRADVVACKTQLHAALDLARAIELVDRLGKQQAARVLFGGSDPTFIGAQAPVIEDEHAGRDYRCPVPVLGALG